MLRILHVWLHVSTVYTISSAHVPVYRSLDIGYRCNFTNSIIHDINELGLSGIELVGKRDKIKINEIKINEDCYGKGKNPDTDLCHERQKGNHTNVIKLDENEFFNKVEYEWNDHLIYLSFSTNLNKTITAGNRSDESRYEGYPLSPHWGYGRLHSIVVDSIGWKPGEYIHWLYLDYEYPDWVSELKTTNVSFILDYSIHQLTEYKDPNQRIAYAYTLVYHKYKHTPSTIAEELITKIGDNFEIEKDDLGLERIVQKKSSAKYNLTKTHNISKGQVGVILAVGELLEGESEDWLFPTSVTSYLVINESDVNNVLYHYDLKPWGDSSLVSYMPGLESYANKRRGLIYYTDSPGQEWQFYVTSIGVNRNISIINKNCVKQYDLNIPYGKFKFQASLYFLNEIKINGVYAGGKGGFIRLDINEYINEVNYYVTDDISGIISCNSYYDAYGYKYEVEGDGKCKIQNYISFCTNKGKCTTNGANSTNGAFKKLENIRVLNIQHFPDHLIQLTYIPNYRPSQLVATNVPFILEFTAPLGVMTEYVNSFEKNVEIYSKTLKNVEKANNEDTIPYEVFFKIKEDFDYQSNLHMDKFRMFGEYTRILEQAPKLNLTTTKTIPKWHVGIKFATGELWRGANKTHWIYPKTMTQTSVIRVCNVIKLLGYYDLTGKLHTYVHSLKKYKKEQHGFVYYEKPNRTALFNFLDERKASRMHYFVLGTLLISITVTLSFKYWNVFSKNKSMVI